MQPRYLEDDNALQAGSADEIKFARELSAYGYAVIDLDIPDFAALSDTVRREIVGLARGANRVQDGWRVSPSVRGIATHPQILRLLNFAYGRRPVPFQTLNFIKGTQQKTHSDTIHFDSFPGNFMCGVWVAYEDADVENGALRYYPGSHRLPAMRLDDFGIPRANFKNRENVYARYEEAIEGVIEAQGLQKHIATIKKGQAFVWTANLLHGGERILDKNRTRLSQVTHYFFDDCVYLKPLWCDFHVGKMLFKRAFDISENRYVRCRYNGKDFRLPLSAYAAEFFNSRIRGVRVG